MAQVLQHLFDTERIFQYRALCISRGDKTPLPGFDQDSYVPAFLPRKEKGKIFLKNIKPLEHLESVYLKVSVIPCLRRKVSPVGGVKRSCCRFYHCRA
ncbi:hypothetical protein [Antarcticibacterium flavum]|uniref:hypothetical protein n=1 Tax=Antarcticibacterium flavum TaxID=2058175 RepID=UPI001FE35B59|nr:hypothetical protein [Antarcticibacterium flavum]